MAVLPRHRGPRAALLTVRLTRRAGGGFLARITFVADLDESTETVESTADLESLRLRIDVWLTETATRLAGLSGYEE